MFLFSSQIYAKAFLKNDLNTASSPPEIKQNM